MAPTTSKPLRGLATLGLTTTHGTYCREEFGLDTQCRVPSPHMTLPTSIMRLYAPKSLSPHPGVTTMSMTNAGGGQEVHINNHCCRTNNTPNTKLLSQGEKNCSCGRGVTLSFLSYDFQNPITNTQQKKDAFWVRI